LRAGLTPKYIDIAELMANLKFDEKPASALLTEPEQQGNALRFPIPVEDFAFAIHSLNAEPQSLAQQSAALLFCIEGQAVIAKGEQQVTLKPGESCFIAASESPVTVAGTGRLARVFNDLG